MGGGEGGGGGYVSGGGCIDTIGRPTDDNLSRGVVVWDWYMCSAMLQYILNVSVTIICVRHFALYIECQCDIHLCTPFCINIINKVLHISELLVMHTTSSATDHCDGCIIVQLPSGCG